MYFLGKNMFHACAVGKFWGVVQVLLMADFVILVREKTLYKTCMW